MITIKDIADKAGVSPTTVSNVLHGRVEKVSENTLKKVERIIKESNYVSNMGARLLANKGSRIIGVIMTYDRRNEKNAIQDPFYSEIVGALESEIRNNQYYMMLYTSGSIEESLNLASAWNIEGLIVLGVLPEDCKKLKKNTGIPIVFIDSYCEASDFIFTNVGLQDEEGAYEITRYLIDNGHRKIAFMADGDNPIGVDYMRLQGHKRAIVEAGLKWQDRDYISLSYRTRERYKILEDFCRSKIKNYTALVFTSDFYAIDAMHFFYDRNIYVPEDISLVGFDDNIYSRQCRPQITTVHQEVSEKAIRAVELLLKLIQGKEVEEYDIKLPIKLVIRNSVKSIDH